MMYLSCLIMHFISVFIYLSSGPSTSSQPAQQQLETGQGSSLAPTPPSQSLSTDPSSLHSPQLSLQFSPSSQLSDLTSDSPPVEGCSPGPSSAPLPDSQGSSTGGEEEVVKVEEARDAKSNKKQQLHCPTCKVTVNSSSQLEAHCSGMYYNMTAL